MFCANTCTRSRYQVSVYRTFVSLVLKFLLRARSHEHFFFGKYQFHINYGKLFALTHTCNNEKCSRNNVKESVLMYFLFCCVHTNVKNSANIPLNYIVGKTKVVLP